MTQSHYCTGTPTTRSPHSTTNRLPPRPRQRPNAHYPRPPLKPDNTAKAPQHKPKPRPIPAERATRPYHRNIDQAKKFPPHPGNKSKYQNHPHLLKKVKTLKLTTTFKTRTTQEPTGTYTSELVRNTGQKFIFNYDFDNSSNYGLTYQLRQRQNQLTVGTS